ncbi:ABC transporter [Leptolyngbya sp. 'hensonii']|uniref:ABC transporter permease n=1 Tax=Leptolyngbya sp. 'hensonii' TaxID=1922337 RepID=UPI00094FD8EC|nr:ABC transporter permease [Leptolyngbya sp. 'hensonii']OLP18905.1 ABC transporter [Leptolyngbya sp. 'hensonii']
MKRILSQCQKELAQFQRDRLTLALAFLLPTMALLIFGFAIRLEAKNIPLVVQDFDHSPLSQAYEERLWATNQFQPTPWTGSDPLQDALDRGIAKATVILPPEFSRNLKAGKPTKIQVMIDGTDANNARVIKNSVQATNKFFLQQAGFLPDSQLVTPHTRIWFNPGRKESLYIVPGVFAVVLWVFPSLLTAIAMVREKEKGTILQVYASSMTAEELLLGKALAYWLIGLTEALFVMGLGSIVFQISLVGDPTPLLLGTLLFLLDAVLFGLQIGVRTTNQNAAVQVVALIGFLTALLLSGFIYPLSNIPFPLSVVSNIVPARYFIEITRDAYVRGTGWSGVWFAELVLVIIGIVLFNIARKGLRQMQLPD